MIRYLRLFARFVEFSFSRAMEFRLDFFFRIVMDLIFYAVAIAFYQVLFLHTGSIGGWGEPEVMIFVSGYLVVDAMQMTLFSNNLWWLPQYVNRGDLDYYLVRPVSSLFFLSLRDFAANSFVNLLMALGLLVGSILRYPGDFGLGRALIYLALLGVGTLVFYCCRLLFVIPVFWTHSTEGLDRVFYGLMKVGERPDAIFRGWIRRIFTILIPFCLMSSFPARLVLDPFSLQTLLHLFGVAAGFFAVILAFWRLGLRSYSSASS